MLLRLCTKFETSLKKTFQISVKNISFNAPKLARYTRTSLRDRLYRQKENYKSQGNSIIYPDSIALRPPIHLIKALGFTIAVYNF